VDRVATSTSHAPPTLDQASMAKGAVPGTISIPYVRVGDSRPKARQLRSMRQTTTWVDHQMKLLTVLMAPETLRQRTQNGPRECSQR